MIAGQQSKQEWGGEIGESQSSRPNIFQRAKSLRWCVTCLTADSSAAATPDLAVTMSHTGSFTVGKESSYTITVTNQGQGSTAGEITLTDILPPGVSFFALQAKGWFCAPVTRTITCTRSLPLEAGQATGLIFTVMPARAGTVINVASVSTPEDSTTGTKSASDQTMIRDLP